MKYKTALFSMLLSATLNTYTMEEPHQRKPQVASMEIEQTENKEPVYIHEGKATSVDRVIGCCIVLSIPGIVFSIYAYDKLKTIMNSHPVLIDVKGYFNGRASVQEQGFYYRTL